MRSFKAILKTATAAAAILAAAPAFAASGTWVNPAVNSNFNTPGNWSAGSVPVAGETATFVTSDTPVINFIANQGVGAMVFENGSSNFTFGFAPAVVVTLGGAGVTRNTGAGTVHFNINAGNANLIFNNSASASGNAALPATYGVSGGGFLDFFGTSGAGNAQIGVGENGELLFDDSSSAQNATIIVQNAAGAVSTFAGAATAGSASIANNEITQFVTGATAGTATIVNNDTMGFFDNSTAGAATITTNAGAVTEFFDAASGGTARFIVDGGTLDFDLGPFTNTAGSIEGATGIVSIAATNLSVGSNDHAHAPLVNGERALTFGGTISGAGGQITKVGTGTLVLTGANTYDTGTNFNGGVLQISADNNLGTGNLFFNGGTLRSTGTFATNKLVTLNAPGGTVDLSLGQTLTFNNPVTGAGGLNSTGLGTLVLLGNSAFAGATTISGGGLLQLGDGATSGNLTATSGVNIGSGSGLEFQPAAALTFDRNITGEGSVSVRGASAMTFSGNNDAHSGVLSIFDTSRVVAQGGTALGDTSLIRVRSNAVAALELLNNETAGGLRDDGLIELNANVLTLNGGAFGDQTYTGVISGVGGSLVKNGAFVQTLTGNQTYTGGTTVNAGTLRINGTVPNHVTVNAGATFGGDFTNSGDLTSNSGNVAPGNSPGLAVTGGNYIAAGAPTYTVDLFANASNAPVNGTTHDFWTINGNVTGANTRILLDTSLNSNLPTATTGNGIEIVRVGGASDTDDFFLSTAVQSAQNGFVGGFQYVVNAQQNNGPGGSDQFFLRNVVREQLVANAVILSASRQVTRDCHRGTEHAAGGSGKTSAWAAARFGTFEADAGTGADYTNNYACVTGGIETPVGDGWTAGLRGGYSNHDVKLNVVQGRALLDGDGWTVEGALTYAKANYYAGVTAGYQQTDWDYDHALVSGGISQADADGAIASLYSGYIVGLGGDARVKFEGQVLFDSTDCDGDCFLAGTVQDTSDWQGRILARANDTWGSVMPYLQVSVSTDFDNGQRVSLGNAVSTVDTASGLFGAALGFSADAGDGWSLGAELATTQGFDSEVEGYQAAFGARKTW